MLRAASNDVTLDNLAEILHMKVNGAGEKTQSWSRVHNETQCLSLQPVEIPSNLANQHGAHKRKTKQADSCRNTKLTRHSHYLLRKHVQAVRIPGQHKEQRYVS